MESATTKSLKRKHESIDSSCEKRSKSSPEDSSSHSTSEADVEIHISKKIDFDQEKSHKSSNASEEISKNDSPQKILDKKLNAIEAFNSTALADEIYERDYEKDYLISFLEKAAKCTDSHTLYICGKPGTGKTATLNYALKSIAKEPDCHVLMFNGMNYADTKPFLVALNKKLCEITGQHHKEKKGFHEMAGQVHENLKSAKTHMYFYR